MTTAYVKEFVRSIIEYTTTDNLEIIVVANGGDTTPDLFQEYDFIRTIYFDHPIGAVPALNIGIKESTGDYIILTNDDCAILLSEKDYWLNELIKPFNDPNMAVTGPFRMNPQLGMSDLTFDSDKMNYGFIIFFCAVIPRKIINEIGLLDETLQCGVDVDFCMKAKALGYKISQVPEFEILRKDGPLAMGSFPFYHQGEGTVHKFYSDSWTDMLVNDAAELNRRYGKKDIKTSIVIPAYGNHLDDLKKCISSIEENTIEDNIEILVIANGCTEEMKDYLYNKKNIITRWFNSPLGATRAINVGFREASGEFIIVLNQDAIITGNNWLNLLISPFDSPDVGIVGVIKQTVNFVDTEFAMFFCVALRKEMIKQIGLLDEEYNPGGFEDIDYCIRAVDSGWKIAEASQGELKYLENQGFVGSFPIYHKENHNEWMTTEIHNRNLSYFKQKNQKHIINLNKENKSRDIIIPTWPVAQKKYELIMLQEFLKDYKIKTVLEIGTYRGGTAMLWAHFVKPENGHVYCADLNFEWGTYQDNSYGDSEYKIYRRQSYNDSEYEKYITEIKGDTHNLDFIKKVYNIVGKVDFIFIDGDHSYEGVKQDFENYCLCVKDGGYIAFHDIGDGYYPNKDCDVDIFWKEIRDIFPSWEFFDNNEYKFGPAKSMGIGVIQFYSHLMDKYRKINKPVMPDNKSYKKRKVSAYISTKDRYNTTLPIAIAGVIGQTVKPSELIIYDDGEQKDLRGDSVYSCLFKMLDESKIEWKVCFGEKKGQVANHQRALTECKYDIIWRLDDDNFPEANVLELLLDKLLSDDSIGGVAGRSVIPDQKISKNDASSLIQDLYTKPNIQWTEFHGSEEVDHFHNTFLFKKEAAKHGYHMGLSPVGHREETMFTFGMKLAGWKLYVMGDVITWHLRQPYGGIRSYQDGSMWEHDERIFKKWLLYNYGELKNYFLVVLDSGLGDHLEFATILPELKKKHKNIILATCYPEVFNDDPDITQISIADAIARLGNIDNHNIYKFMGERNWKNSIKDAYRTLYTEVLK
jgi:GT2 family glycosyltransferase/cephalosporin hydroxylase